MRLFIAIELSPDVCARLGKMQDTVRKIAPNLSFTRPENLHLTLKFLGEVPDANVKAITDALRAIALVGGFDLTIGGFVCFPERGRVRIVSADVRATQNLHQLHQQMESALSALGFPREHRAYHPHVTLARTRAPVAMSMRDKLAAIPTRSEDAGNMEVNEFVLMESTLHPQGARYTPAARFYIKLLNDQQKPMNRP